MTSEERDRMERLCREIVGETNAARFDALLLELNDLLDSRQQRLELNYRNKSAQLPDHPVNNP